MGVFTNKFSSWDETHSDSFRRDSLIQILIRSRDETHPSFMSSYRRNQRFAWGLSFGESCNALPLGKKSGRWRIHMIYEYFTRCFWAFSKTWNSVITTYIFSCVAVHLSWERSYASVNDLIEMFSVLFSFKNVLYYNYELLFRHIFETQIHIQTQIRKTFIIPDNSGRFSDITTSSVKLLKYQSL